MCHEVTVKTSSVAFWFLRACAGIVEGSNFVGVGFNWNSHSFASRAALPQLV